MFSDLADLFSREIAGRRSLDWAGGLSRYHREPGMPGHQKALDYVLDEVDRFGLDEVEAREYVYDGRRVYYSTWASVPPWKPRVGRLEIVSPEQRAIADFEEIPVVLGIRSAPTPPEGITADLVDVGLGTLPAHFEGKNVRGRIVLCDPNGQLGTTTMDLARLYGAKGVVICSLIDRPPTITRQERPDHIGHVWTSYWFLGSHHDFEGDIFSFSVSNRQLAYLRSLLAQGPVTVRALVDAEFGAGTVRQISGLLRGSEVPEEEVVFLGHVDHPWPGANDNASGCGLMMELASRMASLVRDGSLPRPRRSIRFIWGVHLIGSVMWAEDHPGWGRRVLGGFAPDSIGTAIRGGGAVQFMKTSDTRPSYLNDLVSLLAEKLPVSELRSQRMRLEPESGAWSFRESPWSGGVDSGPINDRDIGAHAMGVGGFSFDDAYHTDRDTIARLDAQEFERLGWVLAMAGYLIANADKETNRFLSHLVATRARRRLAAAESEAVLTLEEQGSSSEIPIRAREWLDRIAYLGKRDVAAMDSVAVLGSNASNAPTLDELRTDLMAAADSARSRITRWVPTRFGPSHRILHTAALTDPEARAAGMIPVRRFEGPFNYLDIRRIIANRLGWERTHWLTELQMSLPYPSLSFTGIPGFLLAIDGRMNLLDLAKVVKFEFDADPGLHVFQRLVGDLADAGLIDVIEARGENRTVEEQNGSASK